MVGTVNLTAAPGSSRPLSMSVEYNKPRLLASWACSTACAPESALSVFKVHTMPLLLSGAEEIEGVALFPYVSWDMAGGRLNWPLLNENFFRVSPVPQK